MRSSITRAALVSIGCLCLIASPPPAGGAIRAQRVNPANGHIYYVISQGSGDGLTWAAAEAEAALIGGDLATINDAAENAWVWNRFHSWRSSLWIGLNDEAVEGTFEWVSGESALYRNWSPYEPSGGDEDYVHMWGPTGQWNDLNGTDFYPYGVVETTGPFDFYDWAAPVDGDFHDGARWLAPGPPTATDGAYFAVSGAYTVGFSAPATTLLTRVETGEVTFDLGGNTYSVIEVFVGSGPAGLASLSLADGSLSCGRGSIGYTPGEVGVLNVGAGATWDCTEEAVIGDFGQGTLNVPGGGTVTSASARLGNAPGSLGEADVTGTGASWVNSGFLYVGYEGVGSLRVGPGAEVRGEGIIAGEWPGALGSIEVRGEDARLVGVGPEWTTIGRQGGGSLTVAEGGTVQTDSALNLGGWTTASGEALVTDPNTLLDIGGELIVGDGGEGSLVVRNGASVRPNGMSVGRNWPGSGEVVAEGEGTRIVLPSGWLVVGGNGTGNLTVHERARVDVTNGFVSIGRDRTAAGSLTVSGPGSRLDAAGEFWVGDWGAGLLQVLDGAEAGAWSLRAGISDTGVGAVRISGGGARMELGGWVSIGERSTATLAVRDGAMLTTLYDLTLGQQPEGWGQASVSAAEIQIGQTLRVGHDGTGILLVSDGGVVTAGSGVTLGATGHGRMVVSGPGSSVANTAGELHIGEWGEGVLTVSNGAEVRSDQWINLGLEDGSNAFVTVQDPNTLLRSESGGMVIGSAGHASLYVLDGATVSVDSEIILAERIPVSGYAAVAEVRGAGSLLESRNSGIRVGRRHTGSLAVHNGATVLCQWATIGNEDPTAVGSALITTDSRWIIERELNVGDVGFGYLYVQYGAVVESQYGRIGHHPGSEGTVQILGPGAAWQLDEGLSIGNSGTGFLGVYDGGLVSAPWEINVNNDSAVELGGGRIETTILRFHGNTADLTGFGTVAARAHGNPRVVVASGGTLTVGDPTATDGFALGTAEGFLIESDATLEVLDADYAQFWGPSFQFNNGVLIGRNGLEINVDPNGYGVIVGQHSRAILNPDGTVELTRPLNIGESVARVYSNMMADLGTRTTLAGGGLISQHGVRLCLDDVLEGHGIVGGDVVLAGGVIAADPGESLTIAGRLLGDGVVIGDVDAFVNELSVADEGYELSIDLDVGARTATVYAGEPVTLGPRTTLAGGQLTANCYLLIPQEHMIEGYGEVRGDLLLYGGTLRADGGTLFVDGTVSGYGLLINDVQADTIFSPSAVVDLSGLHDFGGDDVTVYGFGAGLISGWVGLGGGTLYAPGGLVLQPAGLIHGHGTVVGNVTGEGTIAPEGGTLLFNGLVTHEGGTIAGGGVFGLGATGRLAAAGAIDAAVSTAPGSVVELTGNLALGRSGAPGGVELGGYTLVGGHTLLLRGGPAVLQGEAELTGGTISAPDGLDVRPNALITGRGTLRAGTTPADGIDNHGTLAFAGAVTDVRGEFRNRPGGKVIASGGATLAFWDDVDHNGDSMHASQGSFISFFGSYSGAGSFTGTGTVRFEGDLHPGQSPAIVTFEGNLQLAASAVLAAELAEADNSNPADPKYDALRVAGDVLLEGAIDLSWLPRAGDPASKFGGVYDLIVYRGERTGEPTVGGELAAYVASVEPDANLGDGWWAVQVTLHGLLDGDVDLSGAVDGGDLIALEAGLGQPDPDWRSGDMNFDSVVDHLDYLIWKAHAGTALPPGGNLPEPATLLLLAAGAALTALRRRRRP